MATHQKGLENFRSRHDDSGESHNGGKTKQNNKNLKRSKIQVQALYTSGGRYWLDAHKNITES